MKEVALETKKNISDWKNRAPVWNQNIPTKPPIFRFFPYLSSLEGDNLPNPYLRHWKESAAAQHLGPKPNQIPIQMSSVPVLWNYYNEEIPLHFHAGFRGVHQQEDGTIRPIIGWYVTEDPEQ